MLGSEGSIPGAVAEFRAFLAGDWRAWVGHAPEVATWVGYPGFNDRWTDDSPEGIAARRHQLSASLAGLRALDRERLPPDEQLNFDLYLDLLESAEVGVRFGDDALPYRFGVPRNLWMPLNQMDGIHLTASDVIELQPRTSVAEYDDLLRRLAALPKAIAETRALLEAGRKRGLTPPRVAIRGTPDQVARLVPEDPAQSALLQSFAEFPARVPPPERARLSTEARRIYAEHLVPAFAGLRSYLLEEYLPSCRETVGASALPNGSEMYAFRLRWQTTTGLSAAEIHEIGQSEVRRIRREMDAVIARSGFRGTFEEFLEFLRTDPAFFYEQEEELLDGYRAIAKKCDPALLRLFGRLPRLPYGVAPVPGFRAANSPAAYYGPGAPATHRPAYFYVNTHKVATRASWEMEALTLHEAVPGHHLQIALAQERGELPDFRRYSGYTAYVEGWGLYAESLGEELGFYEDPYSKFGQLSFDMWRSVRLVVDTGIHAMGWSREQAVAFFRENTGTSDQDINVEVDRYIVWPGQALAYKIGQLKLRELRSAAEARLGEQFDLRAFHDLVLSQGAIPLGELERRVHGWVDSEAALSGPGRARSQ